MPGKKSAKPSKKAAGKKVALKDLKASKGAVKGGPSVGILQKSGGGNVAGD